MVLEIKEESLFRLPYATISAEYNTASKNEENRQNLAYFFQTNFKLLYGYVTSVLCSEMPGNILFTRQICDVIAHWV